MQARPASDSHHPFTVFLRVEYKVMPIVPITCLASMQQHLPSPQGHPQEVDNFAKDYRENGHKVCDTKSILGIPGKKKGWTCSKKRLHPALLPAPPAPPQPGSSPSHLKGYWQGFQTEAAAGGPLKSRGGAPLSGPGCPCQNKARMFSPVAGR